MSSHFSNSNKICYYYKLYCAISAREPTYLVNLLYLSNNPNTFRLPISKQLFVPKTKLSIGKHTFSAAVLSLESTPIKSKVKASSYIAQYSVLRTALNALHFTSVTDLFTQTPSRLLWEASSSYTYPPLSIVR